MKWLKSSILAVAATASLGAHASLLAVDGGTVTNVLGNNAFFGTADGLGVNPDLVYTVGGQLSLLKDANLTYTYLGKEAGYWNTFTADGQSIVTRDADGKDNAFGLSEASANIVLANVMAGLLDFSFSTNGSWTSIIPKAPDAGTVVNGSNFDNTDINGRSFAILLGQTYKGVFYDALLMFDDAGPGKFIDGVPTVDDDNHDDMLVGLRVVAVPAPAAILLMGLGMIGLGASRRRG